MIQKKMELLKQGCEVSDVIYNEKKYTHLKFLWYGLITTELCECLVYNIFERENQRTHHFGLVRLSVSKHLEDPSFRGEQRSCEQQ